MNKGYYVYIATNKRNTVLYTGVTNNLSRRIFEHNKGRGALFTKKYNICKLIYFAEFESAIETIQNEKKIKGWTRDKKLKLIYSINPEFRDLLA